MRRYLIFISAGLGLLMYSVDTTVVAVAFFYFIKDLGTHVVWAVWTISIYLVAVIVNFEGYLEVKSRPQSSLPFPKRSL
jgi:MFS family permease